VSKFLTHGGGDVGSVHGIPVRGIIRSFDINSGIAYFSLPLGQSDTTFPVKIPAAWRGPKGQFSGGFPERGTNIFVEMAQGNEWVFLSYDNNTTTGIYDNDGLRRVNLSNKFKPGRYLTLVENDISHIVDPKEGIIDGDSVQFSQLDPIKGIYSSRFNQELHFTQANRNITGPLLRDIESNNDRGVSGSSLTSHTYNNGLTAIGLDPRTEPSLSVAANRNPALTEAHSIFYEFVSNFRFSNDKDEARLYAGEDLSGPKPYQRKDSRTDILSLSLDHPNFLLETVIGTVVDIYGNILDINRNPLPSGLIDSLSFRKSEEDQNIVFQKLREQLRKSIAYHFELNARKAGLEDTLPDYENFDNYIRARSRFSVDIDKEGQFKINVPSSSETGNIPVLVRQENFSNLKGAEYDEDRGSFIRNVTNNTDIQLEPHGQGIVELKSNEESLKSFSAATDRITGDPIKLGTGFHDISNVLFLHKFKEPYKGTGGYPNSLLNFVPPVEDIISKEIIVSGEGSNAGGRSGTLSLDGFISLSIGANTVDRQSMWLDCAGGIVAAIGRDKFNKSIAATLDGDLFMQVGGSTISNDLRFSEYNNEMRDGVVDIRVWNSGSFHTIRIDSEGIKIHTPQRLDIVSEGELRLKSVNGNMYFDAENIYMYSSNNARLVLRSTEGAAKTI
jgi:hypothetical protein